MKISIYKAKYYHSQWYYYIIPKRLTLKREQPIYRWLWWLIRKEK